MALKIYGRIFVVKFRQISGQSYKQFTIVIYDSRGVLTLKLPIL